MKIKFKDGTETIVSKEIAKIIGKNLTNSGGAATFQVFTDEVTTEVIAIINLSEILYIM